MEIDKDAFSELKEMGRRQKWLWSGESLLLATLRGKSVKQVRGRGSCVDGLGKAAVPWGLWRLAGNRGHT